MLDFRRFVEEYWGSSFAQEKDLVNGPAYREKGIYSKYQGPGRKELFSNKVDKKFGFSPKDKAIIDTRK